MEPVRFASRAVTASPAAFERWLMSTGMTAGPIEGLGLRFGEVRALAAAVRDVLGAVADAQVPPAGSTARLNGASAAVPFAPALRIEGDRGVLVDDPPTPRRPAEVLAALARSVIRFVGSANAERLRRCPACGDLYVASRPDRVWCSASCGNRARVARHHARRRAD